MIRLIIKFYIVLLLIDAILSFFPEANRFSWRHKLKKICDYTCAPVRKLLPQGLPIDFSPMIVIASLYLFIEIFSMLW